MVASSKNSSHRFVKKSSTQIGGYGWQTRKTSSTLILMRMQLKVSFFVSSYLISHTCFFSNAAHSLNWYRFIGRILGKAMYEGILVDVAFAGFFLAKVNVIACPCTWVLSTGIFSVAGETKFLRRSIIFGSRPVQWACIS